jgi:hypothetical protein
MPTMSQSYRRDATRLGRRGMIRAGADVPERLDQCSRLGSQQARPREGVAAHAPATGSKRGGVGQRGRAVAVAAATDERAEPVPLRLESPARSRSSWLYEHRLRAAHAAQGRAAPPAVAKASRAEPRPHDCDPSI